MYKPKERIYTLHNRKHHCIIQVHKTQHKALLGVF